jgi:hypothetical protein
MAAKSARPQLAVIPCAVASATSSDQCSRLRVGCRFKTRDIMSAVAWFFDSSDTRAHGYGVPDQQEDNNDKGIEEERSVKRNLRQVPR